MEYPTSLKSTLLACGTLNHWWVLSEKVSSKALLSIQHARLWSAVSVSKYVNLSSVPVLETQPSKTQTWLRCLQRLHPFPEGKRLRADHLDTLWSWQDSSFCSAEACYFWCLPSSRDTAVVQPLNCEFAEHPPLKCPDIKILPHQHRQPALPSALLPASLDAWAVCTAYSAAGENRIHTEFYSGRSLEL